MRSFFKLIGIMVMSTVLTSITINATDHFNNFSQSAVGLVATTLVGEIGPCEKGMVFVGLPQGGFCIDQYEASASTKCPFVQPTSQHESRTNLQSAGVGCIPVSEEGREPWRFISQNQAREACALAGKRLPTQHEWFLAALGTPDLTALGDRDVPVSFNTHTAWGSQACNMARNWDTDAEPGRTGSGDRCVSTSGVYDMIGNIWEWTDETLNDGMINGRTLPEGGYVTATDAYGLPSETRVEQTNHNYYYDRVWIDHTGVRGIFRGGYWGSRHDGGLYALHAAAAPSFVGTGVGFRCVQ